MNVITINTIDISLFKKFVYAIENFVDIMIEIKDKEKSALKALEIIKILK